MDLYHFTDDEIAHILKRAVQHVEDAQVPEDLRVAAFTSVVNLCSNKTIERAQPLMSLPRSRH